jgi:phage terminase small subunit
MAVLSSSKYERFAQLVAKGVSATEAYVSAGYSKANAHSNASRLSANEPISARIKELLTAVAERVVEAAARKRSWRVAVLQDLIDDSLALIAARKVMYAEAKGEGRTLEVADAAAEKAAIANGFSQRTTAIRETYPKTMDHPGYPNGAATGMMVEGLPRQGCQPGNLEV